MSNEVLRMEKPQANNYFMPQSFEQAERLAEKIANSSLCPNHFKNKPGDVFIAMQMGFEVGLSPMQAIQNIAVINGKPGLYGDGITAVVRNSPLCESLRQWFEGSIEDDSGTAYCAIKRRGQQEEIRSFSVRQAKKAKLWTKKGPWQDYPERMLQWRATGFCARDTFADALRGLHPAEELLDYLNAHHEEIIIENKETQRKIENGTPVSMTYTCDRIELDKYLDKINNASDIDILQAFYKDAKAFVNGDKAASNEISKATRARKSELEANKKKKDEPLAESETQDNSEWMKGYDGETQKENIA